MRATIRKSAPTAIEAISYGMPTFKLNGNLVHFAGYNAHIGFYPAPSGLRAFREQISLYKNSKGAVQFPLDKKLPLKLVADIVRFRVRENTVEELKQSGAGIFSGISAPARRALESKGIKTLRQLARMRESQVMELHGMGKTTIPKLKALLKAEGLAFIKGNDKPK
jgi:uncharacterized protein YdhG (YjbR/CyaY superfamily)